MTRIRLNNEYRQKFFNRIKHVFEEENTQEKEGYLQARENVDEAYSKVFPLAKEVVERTNLPEDVKVLDEKSEFWSNISVPNAIVCVVLTAKLSTAVALAKKAG